jgi:hypothetical protein
MRVAKLLKFFFLTYAILFIFSLDFVVFAQPLEIEYPSFPQIQAPTRLPVPLPRYIRYLYYFSIIAGGLIAFIALLTGGFRYLTSAGNPSQMADARDQIFTGILGLIIILGSFVILNELNPNLVSLHPPRIDPIGGRAIIIYTDGNCGNGSNGTPGLFFDLPPGISYIKLKGTQAIDSFDVQSFWTSHASPVLTEVAFFRNPDCSGDPIATFTPTQANTCIPTGLLSGIRCVRMRWYIPGVWLFSYPDGNPEQPDPNRPYQVFQMDSAALPRGLRRNVQSIALVPDEKTGFQYGVILHHEAGSRSEKKGWAHLYLAPDANIFRDNTDDSDVSSITVFQVNPNAPDRSITICENTDCQCQPDETGECQDASITYQWDGLEQIPNPDIPRDIAGAIILREGTDEWWPDGHTVAICDDVHPLNWIGHIAYRTGGCFRGVSAIRFESGAQYIAILYNSDTGEFAPNGRGNAQAIVIDGNVRNLQQYRFNELTGGIFIIKVRR